MNLKLGNFDNITVTQSSIIQSPLGIQFNEISIPLAICNMDKKKIAPPDFRFSFQYYQQDLSLPETFSDYNKQLQIGQEFANALFENQAFVIPIQIQSMLIDDYIQICVYQNQIPLKKFKLNVFKSILSINFLNQGKFKLTEQYVQIQGEIIAPVANIVYSQKSQKMYNIQNPASYFNCKQPAIIGIAELQQFASNHSNIDQLLLQRNCSHVQEITKKFEIAASSTEDYLYDGVQNPRLQFMQSELGYDIGELLQGDVAQKLRALTTSDPNTQIYFRDAPNASQRAIDAGISAYFAQERCVSQFYTPVDYCYGQRYFQLHAKPQFGRQLTGLGADALQQLDAITSNYLFEPVENAELLLENKEQLVGMPRTFGYLAQAMVAAEQLDYDLLQQYAAVPLDQMLFLLSYKFEQHPRLRRVVIAFMYRTPISAFRPFVFNLTNCMRFDRSYELTDFLLNQINTEELLYDFSLLPFYLQQHRDSSSSEAHRQLYLTVLQRYFEHAAAISPAFSRDINQTMGFVQELHTLCQSVKEGDTDRPSQIKRLGDELAQPQKYPLLLDQNKSLYFPFLRCGQRVRGLNTAKFHVFKSAKKPILITLVMEGGAEQALLIKFNDDVRPDQMIMQLFDYFDQQLRLQNLQLETSLYGTFAFSSRFGIVECVLPSTSIDDLVLAKKPLLQYLRESGGSTTSNGNGGSAAADAPHLRTSSHVSMRGRSLSTAEMSLENENLEPSADASQMSALRPLTSSTIQRTPLQARAPASGQPVSPQIDALIKSSAFYSISTYLLAVGDRHLENILLRPSGRLFHIDFGWLFGRDPKPRPALMKIFPELITAIGGVEHQNFLKFVQYIVSSFKILRGLDAIIFSLLFTLRGAGITVVEEDEPHNFEWLQARMMKSAGDQEATSFIVQLVGKQLNAVFPRVIDALHRWIQQQRK